MRKIFDNGVFKYKNPVLYKDKANKKWHLSYGIQYPHEDKFRYPKEYGRWFLRKSLNQIKNLKIREKEFGDILEALTLELKNGVDIKNSSTINKYEETYTKLHYDSCLEMYYKNKGLLNPIPKKSKTAEVTKIFHRNQFKPYLTKKNLLNDFTRITKNEIKEFFDIYYNHPDTTKKWSNTSFNNKKALLSSFFSFLVDEEIIEINPVSKIKYKSADSTERFGIYTSEEREIVFNYLNTHHPFMATVVKLIYHAYIRETELTRLRVRDFDFDKCEIVIEPNIAKGQKDGLPRFVFMNPSLVKAIKYYLSLYEHKPDDYIFGKSFKPSQYQIGHSWQHVYTRALNHIKNDYPTLFKTKGLSIYAFKHTGVTDLFHDNIKDKTSGELLYYIKRQCRHEKFEMTEKYLKKLRINIETIDKFIFR